MKTSEVVKRTFEALKHPKGSEERQRLNESAVTSEYMKSYKYLVLIHHPKTETHVAYTSTHQCRTRQDAVAKEFEELTK